MSRFGSLADTPASFLLAGARVIDPAQREDAVRDVAVLEGRIVDPGELPDGVRRIEGGDLVAAPGLCDLHTHLREPGGEVAETIESGTNAAAHGGFTTICAMPNTEPPLDERARVAAVNGYPGPTRVRVVAAATRGRAGERLTDYAELAAQGVVGVSDDGAAIADPRLARGALAYLAELGLPLIEHAEETSLAAGTLMRSGPMATRLGLSGWPPSAELTIVERDIALAAETGGWVHFTHLSTAGGLDAVRRAKERSLRVTCDVTPHHLALTDAWVGGHRGFAWDEVGEPNFERAYDGATRVNPPLPSREDALALLGGLVDGSIDAIATDHAPHPPERKLVEFAAAAPGIIGLETALSLGLAAVEAGCLGLVRLVEAISSGPAGLIGETRGLSIGQVADLVVFDPVARWRVEANALASRSANTPLLGLELPGVVQLTVAVGRMTYEA
ncbi:MAG: dihydroorotase [Chloroflexota bacterium]|nr:dihydroorotase [Chloroflexota bacterium]